MSGRTVGEAILREAPLLRASDTVDVAARRVLDAGLPALPVVGDDERLVGVFGEREFLAACLPGLPEGAQVRGLRAPAPRGRAREARGGSATSR